MIVAEDVVRRHRTGGRADLLVNCTRGSRRGDDSQMEIQSEINSGGYAG
jgi:hypothetical protein